MDFYFNKIPSTHRVIFTRHIFIKIKSIFPSSVPLKRMALIQEISVQNASLLTRKKIEKMKIGSFIFRVGGIRPG